ncbi:type IIG restriction enzyme/methyltransferase [Hymenobacter terricola]|uniref:type IIG restriction enzyme/methyltransferase n=1 Tax=Hymenobacter terricola TaxID=2819236 RepID=UPI001B310C77|nr:Eco57I restriction-modification methylase domain-containing protein [Hymenobacter terricola]
MLLPSLLTPDAATTALRRLRPTPEQLAEFRAHLAEMLRHLDPNKIERHGETHILDFLRSVSRPTEGGSRYGNVHNKRDLVLHLGDTADSPVAVVLEVKGPKNPSEMLAPDDLNRKAFQQLLLYYLEDRTDEQADDFRRLIITTGYEWYVFDAVDFNRLFWKDKALVKAFRDWKAGAKAATDTDFFYKSIAGKKLAALEGELRVAYVDLRPGLPTKATEVLALYRLFHPAYLLKEPLTGRRDPNTLNQEFYNELLYLMGLKEDKQGGLRRIGRCPEAERQPGSLLENTLRKLHTGHGLNNLPLAERAPYGDTLEAQLEEVALALCLMWVNRLLFLKLLEGQLVRYHAPADAAHFRFLHPARLTDYDEVLTLFFEVLNRAPADRSPDVRAAFPEVPYLNSSLFEPSQLEGYTFDISGLRDGLGLAPYPGSVLRKAGAPVVPPAKAHTSAAPQWAALPYLLHFLDAYDFATDPTTSHAPAAPGADAAAAPAAPAPRPLLSAAVLGLVFEKINGYRDGSFYTPGFVTMYMARQTLGRAVLRHFAQAPALAELAGCETLDDLQDALIPAKRARRQEYAAHFNTLTVLDPAVGSGHFLVSALNELLALKSRLGLLLDDDGARLPYSLEVEHDELLVTDADGLPAPYRVATFDAATGLRTVGPERTRLQRALFREKRALMEHALFGVDLNPNSVRICRLRLWIELLKHAYYKPETDFRELETLPNLDLNVKPGNSLLARFALDVDLSEVFKKGGFTLKKYKEATHEYFGSRGREDKNTLLGFFRQIKEQFTAVLHLKDKKREDLRKYRNQRLVLETQGTLFAGSAKEQDARQFDMRRLELLADKLDAEIQAHEQGALFREAFEWRFEFPEVLDEAGAFRGFDVVMGNPPYIRQEAFTALKPHLKQRFGHVFAGTADLYVYFLQLGAELLAPGGELSYIVPNKWLRAGYGAALRGWLASAQTLLEFVDFGDLPVFPEATTYPAIVALRQGAPAAESTFRAAALPKLLTANFDSYVTSLVRTVHQSSLKTEGWNMADAEAQEFLDKLHAVGTPLGEYVKGGIYYGIKTGSNEAFVIDGVTRELLIAKDPNSIEIIKPFLGGRDIKRYQQPKGDKYLLFMRRGIDPGKYPAVMAHLEQYRQKLEPRPKNLTGKEAAEWPGRKPGTYKWYEVQDSIDYWQEFEKEKIIYQVFQVKPVFTFDKHNTYVNNATYIIPGNDLFLLGVLNSKIGWLLIANYCTEIQNGYQLIYEYFKRIPIPAATAAEQAAIAALVQQILAAKAADPAADTAAPEAAVDAAVAALYGVALPAGAGQ